MKKKTNTTNAAIDKIYALKAALESIGAHCELYLDAQWFCTDHKLHRGIELHTDIDTGEDDLSFHFTPDGRHIIDCRQAPVVE